jgi:thiol-disulfide isomerase/thioredoxin
MMLSTPRLVGLLIALVVVGLVGVNFVQAVQPAVEHERKAARDEGCMPMEPTAENPKLGKLPVMAPDIQAQDYTGKMVPLSAYRGKVVLLNFWASWCPPCVEEMPSMDRLQRLFPKDLVVLAVSSDNGWKDILEFFKAEGTKMTVLWDPAAAPDAKAGDDAPSGKVGALSMSYGTDKLPESYLIDRDGTIRYYVVNTRNWASPDAQRCIRKLVEE